MTPWERKTWDLSLESSASERERWRWTVLDMMLATSKDRIPIVCLGGGVFLEEDSRRRACLRFVLIFTSQASATMARERFE